MTLASVHVRGKLCTLIDGLLLAPFSCVSSKQLPAGKMVYVFETQLA